MIKTRTVTRTAVLLALAVASQFLKNTSVYITGPVINCLLVLAVLSCGLASGIAVSCITPVTAFLITGSPLMSALPLIIPCIMLGNCALCVCVHFIYMKRDKRLIAALAAGACAKAAFMGLTISAAIIGLIGPSSGLPGKALDAARVTFSLTQLITAATGCAAAYAVWKALRLVPGIRK